MGKQAKKAVEVSVEEKAHSKSKFFTEQEQSSKHVLNAFLINNSLDLESSRSSTDEQTVPLNILWRTITVPDIIITSSIVVSSLLLSVPY